MESCAKTMLFDLLSNKEFGLALSPGFFRIYLIVGILHAMDDCGVLNPTCVSGSSAGAMAGGFLASGLSPEEMIGKLEFKMCYFSMLLVSYSSCSVVQCPYVLLSYPTMTLALHITIKLISTLF